jgi:hypothetical protein
VGITVPRKVSRFVVVHLVWVKLCSEECDLVLNRLGYRNKDCRLCRSKYLLGQSKINNKLGERTSIPE